MSGDKIKVKVVIEETVTFEVTKEMTRAEYDLWTKRLDEAKGFEGERVAEELFETCGFTYDGGDLTTLEVSEFSETEKKEAA